MQTLQKQTNKYANSSERCLMDDLFVRDVFCMQPATIINMPDTDSVINTPDISHRHIRNQTFC